tara:strand:+ start:55 stop:555 length:501 start_codon:yes stop_codon:yes gene_type:complete
MKKQTGGTVKKKRKYVTQNYIDNPDVISRRVVKKGKKNTKVKESADTLLDIEYQNPAGTKSIKKERQPYKYNDKVLQSRKYKSKRDNITGEETKRKEKIVYDEGNQMKKRKQKKIRFGKNKGKIKSKTVSWKDGKRTVSKSINSKVDRSKLQTGGFHLEPGIESID